MKEELGRVGWMRRGGRTSGRCEPQTAAQPLISVNKNLPQLRFFLKAQTYHCQSI